MPSLVMVRWLQPARYRGVEEAVVRSRIRQRGELAPGSEVRVRYRRCYYKAEVIGFDVPSEQPPEDASTASPQSPSTNITSSTPVSADSIIPELLATVSPVLLLAPQASLEEAASLTSNSVSQATPTPTSPGAQDWSDYVAISPQSFIELYRPSPSWYTPDSYSSAEELGDLSSPAYIPATSVLSTPDHSRQDTVDSPAGFPIPAIPPRSSQPPVVLPRSTDETHECVDKELLDRIVQYAEASPREEVDFRLSPMERFQLFLFWNLDRITLNVTPRLRCIIADLKGEEQPCPRCITNVSRAMDRVEGIVQNLAGFLDVATRMVLSAQED